MRKLCFSRPLFAVFMSVSQVAELIDGSRMTTLSIPSFTLHIASRAIERPSLKVSSSTPAHNTVQTSIYKLRVGDARVRCMLSLELIRRYAHAQCVRQTLPRQNRRLHAVHCLHDSLHSKQPSICARGFRKLPMQRTGPAQIRYRSLMRPGHHLRRRPTSSSPMRTSRHVRSFCRALSISTVSHARTLQICAARTVAMALATRLVR